MKRGLSIGTAAAAAALVLTVGTPGSAYAVDPPTGVEACPGGTLCLYYNSPGYGWGAFAYWGAYGEFDLSQYSFGNWGNGSGHNQVVANNAASVVNNSPVSWWICGQPGLHYCATIKSGYFGPLPAGLYNQATYMTGG
jgi:hypothetical protein